MNIVKNEEFWRDKKVVQTQNVTNPIVHWYEEHLISEAKRLHPKTSLIHVVGCGTGREIKAVHSAFPDARIIATDISPAMIAVAKENIRRWNIVSNVQLLCLDAMEIGQFADKAGIIFTLNSMMTYIIPEQKRSEMFTVFNKALNKGGVLAGVVHNRSGNPLKTSYFLLDKILNLGRMQGMETGDWRGGFSGLRVICHYFTKKEVTSLCKQTFFVPIQTISLRELAGKMGRTYWRGDNNLLFFARKPK